MKLEKEHNYEFRRRLNQVHIPDRWDESVLPCANETVIGPGWRIVISLEASDYLFRIGQDLQDYLAVSMGIPVLLERRDVNSAPEKSIILAASDDMPGFVDANDAHRVRKRRGYRMLVEAKRIVLCGKDERGTAQGSYRLEDIMNLRRAPFVPAVDIVREPLFSPRMVHSGWGIDNFPEQHLNNIAHAGLDAILVFTTGLNMTNTGPLDFNNLIDRAEAYGLDVYLYSYLRSRKHPDEPDAEAFYENLYGTLIKTFPRVKGIIFVGESCEFPSKDERTKGRLHMDPAPPGQENDPRPSPGWWPCRDYPQWLNMVKRIMRKYNPSLDVVFWTYNWGWAPVGPRLELISQLPTDISLEVTFEMFEDIEKDGIMTRCVDYTASFAGPGMYFQTEAKAAKARRIPLYAMANTGGLSWDIGVIPYEPIPFLWKIRWDAIKKARRDWGLCGLMECHHYGWFPSFISELSKEAYWSNGDDFDTHILRIAERMFGHEGAGNTLEAWKLWSSAFQDYVPTNEDQYGPFRVGPSYPLLLGDDDIKFPDVPYAHNGANILIVKYRSHNPSIVPGEIKLLERMAAKMKRGLKLMHAARKYSPPTGAEEAERMLVLGEFILRAVRTTIHTKQWFLQNQIVQDANADDEAKRTALLNMLQIGSEEILNANSCLPFVEKDSRLGWEPSMEYMCDPEHIIWKITQLSNVLTKKIPALLATLNDDHAKQE